MKKLPWLILFSIIPFFCLAQPGEGFYKKSETKVYFKGIGDYVEKRDTKGTAKVKLESTDSDFKGEDFFKNLATDLFLKTGKNGERLDLIDLKIASINHKKKEYSVRDIKPITSNTDSINAAGTSQTETPETEETPGDSTIRIIRQEFRVNKLDGARTFGSFECGGHEVTWVTEWEVIATGEKGKDSLRTEVWATESTADLQKAIDIEKEFSSAYLEALGIDVDQMANNVLGLDWGKVLGSLKKESSSKKNQPTAETLEKLQEIKGYPIYVKGGYFAQHPKPKTEENSEKKSDEQTEPDYSDPTSAATGAAGGFLKKKLFGGKKDTTEKPNLGWESTVYELKIQNFGEPDLGVPSKYKFVEKK